MNESQKALLLSLFSEAGPETPPLPPEAQAQALHQAWADYSNEEVIAPGTLVVEKNPSLTSRKPASHRSTVLMFWRYLEPDSRNDELLLQDWLTRFDHNGERFDCLLAIAREGIIVLFPSDSRFYRTIEPGESLVHGGRA